MPIYEYRCDRCGVFEVTQRITEPALEKCPTCRKKVSRLISATSFQLKGSGWYVTDYARKGSAGAKDAGGDTSAAEGAGSSSGGTEANGTSATSSATAESKASAKPEKKPKATAPTGS